MFRWATTNQRWNAHGSRRRFNNLACLPQREGLLESPWRFQYYFIGSNPLPCTTWKSCNNFQGYDVSWWRCSDVPRATCLNLSRSWRQNSRWIIDVQYDERLLSVSIVLWWKVNLTRMTKLTILVVKFGGSLESYIEFGWGIEMICFGFCGLFGFSHSFNFFLLWKNKLLEFFSWKIYLENVKAIWIGIEKKSLKLKS